MKRLPVFFLCAGLWFAASSARGDGEAGREDYSSRQNTNPDSEYVNAASDASFDKRLPPVLPGERLKDSGTVTRVWSTSGPVVVGNPEGVTGDDALRLGHDGTSIGVIIDRRGGVADDYERGKRR